MWLVQPMAHAQLADSIRIIAKEGWIEKMDNYLTFKAALNNAYETFSQKNVGLDFALYPNITTILNLGLDYRFISFSVGFAPKFFPGNGDDETYGNTKTFSLGMSTIFSHWMAGVKYGRVQGYYLHNTSELIDYWQKGDPYLQLPKHETVTVNANLGYSFNDKLSFRSLTSFTERQLKSAGSFIPAIYFEFFRMDPHRPPSARVFANPRSENYELVIGPGYYYTYVHDERFFASIGAYLGAGFVHSKISIQFVNDVANAYQNDAALRWEGKAAIGYNGRSFFTGFYVNISDLYYEQNNNRGNVIQDLHAYYQFMIGVRLGAPKWLKRQMNKMEEKMEPYHKS